MQLENLLKLLKVKKERYREIAILISIFLIGFAVRYLAHGPRIGPELDTWYHYRIVKYLLAGGIPQFDPLAYYPTGREVRITDPLGLAYSVAYSYKIAKITGISLMDYMVAFPAIFTSLAAIPLYFLTKEIFEERTAFLTALLWQVIPATLTRTHAGFVDKESISSVYTFLALFLFFKSVKILNTRNKKTFLLSILSGMFMALANWSWGGAQFSSIVLALSISIYALVNKLSEKEAQVYISTILFTVSLTISRILVQPLYFTPSKISGMIDALILFLVSGVFLGILLKKYILQKMGEEKAKQASFGIIAAVILAGLAAGKIQAIVYGIINLVQRGIIPQTDRLAQTVAENMPPNFYGGGNDLLERIMAGDWFAHFNVSLFLFPIGALLALKRLKEKRDFGSIFFALLLVSAIFAMRGNIRLSFVLTPPVAMAASYGIFGFLNNINEKTKNLENTLKNTRKEKIKYQAEKELGNVRIFKVFFVLLLFWGAVATANAATSMLDPISVDVPEQWYKAMTWIRENTEENAVIISWWDYGYWIQAIGMRTTVVDGGNAGQLVYDMPFTENLEYRGSKYHRDEDIALMFTAPEEDALKYLRPYVDYAQIPTYVLVSYEEFGKSSAINHIAQDKLFIFPQSIPKTGNKTNDAKALEDFITKNGIESYFIVDYGNSFLVWITGFAPDEGYNAGMKDKVLAKLLPFTTGYGKDMRHFKLVYTDSPWNYVTIYKVMP